MLFSLLVGHGSSRVRMLDLLVEYGWITHLSPLSRNVTPGGLLASGDNELPESKVGLKWPNSGPARFILYQTQCTHISRRLGQACCYSMSSVLEISRSRAIRHELGQSIYLGTTTG